MYHPKKDTDPSFMKTWIVQPVISDTKNIEKNKVDTTRTQNNSCNWLLPIPILNIMFKWLHWIWMDVPADNGSMGCSNGLNEIRKRDNNPVPCIWSIEAIPNVQIVGHHFCVQSKVGHPVHFLWKSMHFTWVDSGMISHPRCIYAAKRWTGRWDDLWFWLLRLLLLHQLNF